MINKLWLKLKTFFVESKRVFKITKKPSNEEFKTIIKVTAIGAALIGLIGAVIQIGFHLMKLFG
jgi:protein transport protein SEC61 subunit gamma-like protein